MHDRHRPAAEADTPPARGRTALAELAPEDTVIARAFSGRPGRAMATYDMSRAASVG